MTSALKLKTALGGSVTVLPTNTADNITVTLGASTPSGGGTNTLTSFGGVPDGVTDSTAALVAAIAAAGITPITFDGVFHIATATTITCPIVDTVNQIFSITSNVTIANGMATRPEWWGINNIGAFDAAIVALPSTGGTVQLEAVTYKPSGYIYGYSGLGTGKYISKDNLLIKGKKMPRIADDCRSLVDGTVIQGSLIIYANNIELRDLGGDAGYTVNQTYYGGVSTSGPIDGIVLTYPDTTTKAASPVKKRALLHNVVGLSVSPTSPSHAIIAGEGYYDVCCTGELIGCMGIHGVVFKCAKVTAESISSYCNSYEGLIIKSDTQATAQAYDITIDRVYIRAQGPIGSTPYATTTTGTGIYFHAAGGTIDKVHIGIADIRGHSTGIGFGFGGTYSIAGITFDTVVIDGAGATGTVYGMDYQGTASNIYAWHHVNNLEVRTCTTAVNLNYAAGSAWYNAITYGKLHISGCTNGIVAANQSKVVVNTLICDTVSNAGISFADTPTVIIGNVVKASTTPTMYSPALSYSNSWTTASGGNALGFELTGGRVTLDGLVKPGSTTAITTLPVWLRPSVNKRFLAQGYDGANLTNVPVLVASTGTVYVNEVTGTTTNCSSWVSLAGINYAITS